MNILVDEFNNSMYYRKDPGGMIVGHNVEMLISQFKIEGDFVSGQAYGSGHINDTYLVIMQTTQEDKYILQRVNHNVFKQPEQLMENVRRVTEHIRSKVLAEGGDVNRQCLNLFPTKSGKCFFCDSDGNHWRVYQCIHDAVGYDIVDKEEIAYEGGRAFGQFQTWLVDLPGGPLFETIPHFNDPEFLLERFFEVLKEDKAGRSASIVKEIEFVKQRAYEMQKLVRMGREGSLPIRITHNDTKLNNVLIDIHTNKATCVIDLDTVMPGFALNDYGDSIRTGTNTGAEDDADLSKVGIDMALFEAYTQGYLEYAKAFLTETEKNLLAFSGKLYPFIIGLRFITDYLDGDNYFKIHHEHHNLQRARAQFKLLSDMENKFDLMNETVERIYNSI